MNRKAFVVGAAMVLLCNLVAVTLRSYAEAAFLASYGASRLPWLLIANASGFAVATFAYDLLTRRAHTRIVDQTLLVALLVVAAASPTLLERGVPPVVLVVALAALSQVAGLALWNRVAASVAGRDARRMLPRAGAAVTLGGAIAGLGAGVLVVRLGVTVLPYIGATVTAIVLVLVVIQDHALAKGGAPGATAPPGTPEGLAEVHVVLLRALIAVAVLEGIVATVIDLQFVSMLKSRYHGDSLAAAVALFYGGTNAILFLLQVSAVPRLLVTRSVPTTASIHPMFAIALYVVFVAMPGFVVLAATRTADQVLRLATSRTSQEIELSPLPPGPRARWKVLLRGGMWPLGAALAACVLLLIGPGTLHPSTLAGAAVAVAVVWFFVAQLAARRFQAALAAPLGIRSERGEDLQRIDLATLERWSLAAGSEDKRSSALARAALDRARVASSDLAEHLRHDEPAVRAALFTQLVRQPSPALRAELRAAVVIEDDDRALSLGLAALALAGDDGALVRGRSRAQVSREVADAVRSAERTLVRGTSDRSELVTEIERLLARDPAWATALLRVRVADLDAVAVSTLLSRGATTAALRAGALYAIAHVGSAVTLPLLGAALEAGDANARAAIVALDADGAVHLAAQLSALSPVARTQIARALAGAPAGVALLGALISDEDAEVAHAALRTALAIARGGGTLAVAPIAEANTKALDALLAHLDARDAAGSWSAAARDELELAIRRCVARLLWAAAVETAAAGRDAATLAATARHLIGGREPDRKRALDVIQEVQAGRAEILAVIERWMRPPIPSQDTADTLLALSLWNPWLAQLGGGELPMIEPRLAALRKPALFATMPGPALASLADRATERTLTGVLFAQGDAGDSMFAVLAGSLVAERVGAPARTIGVGGVVGELAVLTRAPRAATIRAGNEGATVLEIDRDTFLAAAQRAPELVLGLSATLAGWLAPERPDVLG